MNPGGPIEEGGKVAAAIVESLKAQPMTLALVVFNLIFVTLVFMSSREYRAATDRTVTNLLDQQKSMVEKLANCSPDQPKR